MLLAFSVFWFFGDDIIFRSDSMVYLKEANDLITNGDFDYRRFPFRGPIFTLITSSLLSISDNNPLVVGLVPRAAGVASIIFFYLIARLFTGPAVASVGLLLLVTTPLFVEMAGTYHIDLTLTAFTLASLYYFIKGVQLRSNWAIFFSGLLYGIAYLTKELVVLMLPLVFLLALFSQGVDRKKWVSFFYSGAVIPIGLWAVFIKTKGYSLSVLLGRHVSEDANTDGKFYVFTGAFDGGILDALGRLLIGLAHTIQWFFAEQGILLGLLVAIAMPYLFVRFFVERKAELLCLLFAPLAFTPFLAYWGYSVISSRQLTVFVVLSVLSIIPVLDYLSRIRLRGFHWEKKKELMGS